MAIVVAVVALVPQIKGFAQCAVDAKPLAAEYGKCEGQLLDAQYALQTGHSNAEAAAQWAVANFETVKAKKDALVPYPKDLDDIRHGRRAPQK
jgi:hypothetical protein